MLDTTTAIILLIIYVSLFITGVVRLFYLIKREENIYEAIIVIIVTLIGNIFILCNMWIKKRLDYFKSFNFF